MTIEIPSSPGGDVGGRVLAVETAEAFASWLRGRGYATITARQMRSVASVFSRWTREHQIGAVALDETAVESHLAHHGRCRGPKAVRRRRATLQIFLAHLRATGLVRSPAPVRPVRAPTSLQVRYELYLRRERGLAEKSVRVYRPTVREFLAACCRGDRPGGPGHLGAEDVRDFLLRRVRTLSPASAKSIAAALRSFLRFLFLRGETPTDLSLAVPTVRCTRGRKVHPYLRPSEVEQLLGSCDAATAGGRRDHAVLLLLARLGLRASEVVALSLDDIAWSTAEIVVRGKGRTVERLPLLSDVGEALALYLRETRGASDSRRVFLRLRAPREGLTGPSAIGSIVRRALERAGLRPALRGAHLLRYSLATTMIRHGASLTQIGQILRHTSPTTTEIYAKVGFESLRSVAPAWPCTGGAR